MLEYASNAYSSISVKLSDSLERFQRKAARICLRLPLFSPVHHSSLLHQVGLPTLYSRRKLKLTLLAHSIHYQYAPPHILDIPITLSHTPYALRKSRTFCLPVTRTNRHRDSPLCAALHSFNQIPIEFRNHSQRGSFKNIVTEYLLSSICTCSDHSSVQF